MDVCPPGPQDWERVCLCCFKPPSTWCFVLAAPDTTPASSLPVGSLAWADKTSSGNIGGLGMKGLRSRPCGPPMHLVPGQRKDRRFQDTVVFSALHFPPRWESGQGGRGPRAGAAASPRAPAGGLSVPLRLHAGLGRAPRWQRRTFSSSHMGLGPNEARMGITGHFCCCLKCPCH